MVFGVMVGLEEDNDEVSDCRSELTRSVSKWGAMSASEMRDEEDKVGNTVWEGIGEGIPEAIGVGGDGGGVPLGLSRN